MHYLIRRGVFETNSSSCHTLTIADTGTLDFNINTNDILHITGQDFGWQREVFSDPVSKISYLAVGFTSLGRNDLFELLKEVILENTLFSDVTFDGDGYIDHQSIDLVLQADTKEKMKAFVFNPKSYVRTDNDN